MTWPLRRSGGMAAGGREGREGCEGRAGVASAAATGARSALETTERLRESAAPKAAQLGKRSSGRRSRARASTSSTASGRPRSAAKRSGVSLAMRAATVTASSPGNARRPEMAS